MTECRNSFIPEKGQKGELKKMNNFNLELMPFLPQKRLEQAMANTHNDYFFNRQHKEFMNKFFEEPIITDR